MSRTATWASAVATIAIVIGIVRLIVGDSSRPAPRSGQVQGGPGGGAQTAVSVRPNRPPGPGDPKPPPVPEPVMPVLTPAWKAQIADQVRDSPRPGEAAFRAMSERYVDDNLAFAERQAATEGLTVPEVRELTYFGLLVVATQRTPDLEEITGHPMTPEQGDALADLMQSANHEFRTEMRAAVARGAGALERWALIRTTEARYQDELFRITGLDAQLLDDMLFGNLALPGAPGRGVQPSEASTRGRSDDPIARERPTRMP